MQPKFSYAAALAGIALFATVVAADDLIESLPDRMPAPPALATVQLEPLTLRTGGLAPLILVGAWQLNSQEPRFGGVSGLATDGGGLIAVSDGGTILRLPKPHGRQMRVQVADLPGPGDPRFKMNRDSEALLRDTGSAGWWVPFENRDELWLYDRNLGRSVARIRIPSEQLGENTGIEALAGSSGEVLAFPEAGGSFLRWDDGRWTPGQLGWRRRLSDAAGIDGWLFLLERRITFSGFENALALVEPDGEGFRTLWRRRLPVAWRDNLEALAAERAPGGGYRLWIMSDDNFHPRLRTVLLAINVPAAALPKRP